MKTRLLKRHRALALDVIRKAVTAPEEAVARALVEAGINERAQAIFSATFPEKDMQVLVRYRAAVTLTEIKVAVPCIDYESRKEVGIRCAIAPVLVPANYANSWSHFSSGDDFTSLHYGEMRNRFIALDAARRAEQAAKDEKVKMYAAVVNAARNVEDLIELIPFLAPRMRRMCESQHPILVLNDQLLAAVKADAATIISSE